MGLKSLEDLLTQRTGKSRLNSLVQAAEGRVEWLEPDPQSAASTLLGLQVSTRTPLGTVAYFTGGLLVDHGWLRILGSGHPRMRWGLAEWNGLQAEHVPVPNKTLLAHDVLGGFFSLEKDRLVTYFSPDTLNWEATELSYGDWLDWALGPFLEDFYEDLRWPGWEAEVEELESSQGLLVEPHLFQRGPILEKRSRRAVPMAELWRLYQQLARDR